MSETFVFTENATLVSNLSFDENVWNQQAVEYTETALNQTVDGTYVTAHDGNETQYLSVLESNDSMSIPDDEDKTQMSEDDTFTSFQNDLVDSTQVNVDDQQLVVFTVEGSNDLYGMQLAQDDEGNVQKYEFKLRTNDEGELEAIPETFRLVSNVENNENVVLDDAKESNDLNINLYVEEEDINQQILNEDFTNLQEELRVYTKDIKSDPSDKKTYTSIKEEFLQESFQTEQPEPEEMLEYDSDKSKIQEELFPENFEVQNQIGLPYETISKFEPVYIETPAKGVTDNSINQVITQNEPFLTNDFTAPNSYQLVEGAKLATLTSDYAVVINDLPSLPKTSTPKSPKPIVKIVKESNRRPDSMLFYVVHPEKENLGQPPYQQPEIMNGHKSTLNMAHPRSILKNSYSTVDTRMTFDENLNSKRFARGKEAIQARLFHNFINRTTIPQAPVRKDRLPRKQKINPVERNDEEIIVQEVMVSAKGFIAPKPYSDDVEVCGFVEISDSDDDYDPKNNGTRKKKRHRKSKQRIERRITISDSDESDQSVIEIDQSDDEEEKKSEIQCPRCPKSFPSQNSLRTHLQHHNLENSLLKKAQGGTRKGLRSEKRRIDHKCNDCNEIFANDTLLKRHKCRKHQCTHCMRKFSRAILLNAHQKAHKKESLCKSTMIVNVPPKISSPSRFKYKFRCDFCGKICSSQINLDVHKKSHKQFVCTCRKVFPSRYILDRHRSVSCTKSPKSPKKISNLACDKCSSKFTTCRKFYDHSVLRHGFDTPEKTVFHNKSKLSNSTNGAHGGVPLTNKLRKAYEGLRSKLEFEEK